MRNLNIAIIGCRNIGKKILNVILNDKYTKIKLIVSPKKIDNN